MLYVTKNSDFIWKGHFIQIIILAIKHILLGIWNLDFPSAAKIFI